MSQDVSLMAHLMRRAGFGATRNELDEYLADGYETTVDNLLDPGESNHMPDDLIRRYHVDQSELRQLDGAGAYWLYRMLTTSNPLEEKLALFWHGLFATGYAKLNQARALLNQIDMFRQYGFGSFRDLLVELSRDPAMILWLDNNENHKEAINENYGRELLELFSMGIGNYSEHDIKECAKAFTGWTLKNAAYMSVRASKDSIWPYGRIAWHYEYRADDHDSGEKKFLGEVGNFNGEDIVDIIVTQEPTARFLSTRLFQYFASDEVDDDGVEVIKEMMDSYFESGFKVSAVLRTLFNSDYFKSEKCRYSRVKGPVESVVGTARLAGSYQEPTLDVHSLWAQTMFMGQGLLAPPTVEGWHEGVEWIDSGSLVERINFASDILGNTDLEGVQSLVNRLMGLGDKLTPEQFVDGCLDLTGPVVLFPDTMGQLISHASQEGELSHGTDAEKSDFTRRSGEMFQMIAATAEFQFE